MSRTGGRYRADRKGNLKRIAPPTQDHPKGNRAREEGQKDQPTRVVAQKGGE